MPQFPYQNNNGAFTGIPTLAEWTRLTTVYSMFGMHTDKRTNLLLLSIDTAIKEYEEWDAIPFNRFTETPASQLYHKQITALLLISIAKQSLAWVEAKNSSTKSSKRRSTIIRLNNETIKCFKQLALGITPKAGLTETADMYTSLTAQIRLQMLVKGIKQLGYGRGAKVLDKHYWLENNSAVNPTHRQGGSLRDNWDKSTDRFAFAHVRNSTPPQKTVKYATKNERWQFMIIVKRDETDGVTKLYRLTSLESEPVLMNVAGRMFIIDKAGKFYCSMGIEYDGHLFHHSTMMAGVGVLFAGAISVTAGLLIDIDNASGHYRPEKQHLLQALGLIKTVGIPLNITHLNYMIDRRIHPGAGEMMNYMQIYNNAELFYTTQGACPHDRIAWA